MSDSGFWLVVIFLCGGMVLSVWLKKLTVGGVLAGGAIGLCVYAGAGATGLAMLAAFFILGTAATAFKKDEKEHAGLSSKKEAQRTAGQVVANGGMAALLGLLAALLPQYAAVLQLMLAASLSSAAADTVSSEIGIVLGKRFYNSRTLQKDARGLDGVVSQEGTLAGLAGSGCIALLYGTGFGFNSTLLWIIIAGTIGNFSDSLLGATLERSHLLRNNAVNFLNTAIAAFVALLLSFI